MNINQLNLTHYEKVKIDVELCKKNYNRTKIAYVSGTKNKSITPRFGSVGELEFDIEKYIKKDNEMIMNPAYDLINGDSILKVTMLKKVDYFVVVECNEDAETDSIKHIVAYSYQYTFKNKMIRSFKGVKKLYDMTAPDESVLHEVIRLNPSWKIGYINHDINLHRTFDVDQQDLLSFLYDLQKTYKCIITFDNVNRTISMDSIDNIGLNKGLVLNERNYVKHLSIEPNFEDIVTRLYVYGKDDLGINRLTTTGAGYLENFDYYLLQKNLVDDDLVVTIRNYQKLLESKDGEFKSLLKEQTDRLKEKLTLQNQLNTLNTELKKIHDSIDVAIKSGQGDLSQLKSQQDAKDVQIKNKENEIKAKQNQVDAVSARIDILRKLISIESNFTTEQYLSLNELVKESTYRDNNIFEEEELLKEGEKYLEKVSQPSIKFSIDAVNFLQCLEQQINWNKVILGLGDIVNIENEKINKYFKVRLVEYTYQEDGTDFNLLFSNKDSLEDSMILFEELEKKVNSTSTTVDINKFKYGEYDNDKNEIMDYINQQLDLGKQGAIAGKNDSITINERGILLVNEDNQNHQTKIMSNLFASTRDNWRTCSVSIRDGKIAGEEVIGKLIVGNELIIGDKNGIINIVGDKQIIKNNKGETKVILGQYEYNKFGLKIFSKNGDVILDEDGLLNTFNESKADNVDNSFPLRLWVYVPQKVKEIKQCILRFKLEPFRSYSKSAMSKKFNAVSTSDGGKVQNLELTSQSSAITSGATGFSDKGVTHNHGLTGIKLAMYNGFVKNEDGVDVLKNGDYVQIKPSGEHVHNFDIPSHTHRLTISDHSHSFTVPEHGHSIEHGIYEGSKPRNVRVAVNGRLVGNVYNSDQYNIDIKKEIKIGQWNEIQISSERLGRIDASIFMQVFTFA